MKYLPKHKYTGFICFGGAFAGFPKNHPCFIGLIIGIFVNGKVQLRQ